ncbi:aminoglycoside 6'-N-acetyltransferase [Kitasatospora cineracea]|uniref:Aminoglycoside 6'-N-acetyltransferase n=1 Tax=Kitasatospora cineracea TaxID=88074 RepID=A0A8G1UB65_9ACTN|nr:aminoglycoside 6'-N-acetyltransferase [Kitasatospora cineracea]
MERWGVSNSGGEVGAVGGGSGLDGVLTRLVPTGEDDLELLAGWFADPGFVEHWGGAPLSRQEVAEKYLGRRRPQVESFLVLAADAPVGYAQYWRAGPDGGGLDLVLVPHARGRGLGPDAARALLAHLVGESGWRRVTVDPAAANVRAVRAWEKAGFRRVPPGGGGELPDGGLLLEYRPGW